MKAQDLRIGNLVLDNHKNIVEIRNGWEIDEGDYTFPIPLTEEWLIKFGFDFDGYCSYWKSEIELTKDTMDEHFQSFNNVGSGLCQKEIKYVHQLQNLYFALTGEELTIKKINHK